MSVTAAIVLLACCWFLVLFIVLPLNLTTQADTGRVVPGTHRSSPDGLRLGRKVLITSAIAIPLWIAVSAVILSGRITVQDFDWFGVMDHNGGATAPGSGAD